MYRIALVEDDPELSMIISKMLERYQYEVEVVKDFKNVIDQLIEMEADVV